MNIKTISMIIILMLLIACGGSKETDTIEQGNITDAIEEPIVEETPEEVVQEEPIEQEPAAEVIPSTVRVTLYARDRFEPSELNIRPGTTIEVLIDEQLNGVFTIQVVGVESQPGNADGDIASFTFDEVGEYTIKQVPLFHVLPVTVSGERIESSEPTEETNLIERTSSGDSLPNREFTIDELKQYIRDFTHKTYEFHKSRDTNEEIYFTSPKTWGIHKLSTPMQSSDDFITKMKNPSWDIWNLYRDPTGWNELYTQLTESQLEKAYPDSLDYQSYRDSNRKYFFNYKYEDYLDDSEEIYIDRFESPVETERGAIPQFGIMAIQTNIEDTWASNWKDPLLIYKIPCTKDIIVYYNPEDSGFEDFIPTNLNKEQIIEKWQAQIESTYSTYKEDIEAILSFCGVSPELYSSTDFKPFTKSEIKLTRNNNIHYLLYFDHEFEYSAKIEQEDDEIFILKEVDFTFKNLDDEIYDGEYSKVMIQILINDSDDMTHFMNYNLGPVEPGKEYKFNKKVSKRIQGEKVTLTFIPAIEIVIKEVSGYTETTYWVPYPVSQPINYEPELI